MESITVCIYLCVAFTGIVCGDVNIALGKQTTASSLYDRSLLPGILVDGNNNPRWSSRSCFSTKIFDTEPWWMVDLGAFYRVNKVTVTNREDCCWSRLHDFAIEVFANNPAVHEEMSRKLCYFHLGAVGKGATVALHCGTSPLGRFVRVSRNVTHNIDDYLNLCEVEVYGTEERAKQWIFHEIANQKMNGGMLYTVFDHIDCARGCYKNPSCVGFNYRTLPSVVCYLIFEPGALSYSSQWNFYFLDDVLSSMFV